MWARLSIRQSPYLFFHIGNSINVIERQIGALSGAPVVFVETIWFDVLQHTSVI